MALILINYIIFPHEFLLIGERQRCEANGTQGRFCDSKGLRYEDNHAAELQRHLSTYRTVYMGREHASREKNVLW